MPRRDGTGPMGMGSRTGRGIGLCNVTKVMGAIGGAGLRLGLGFRGGFGRNASSNVINAQNQKDLLMEEKAILENRLSSVNSQLNPVQDDK